MRDARCPERRGRRAALGRFQLELGPQLVEAVLGEREEDQPEHRPAVLRGRQARVRAQRVGRGPESPLELDEIGHGQPLGADETKRS